MPLSSTELSLEEIFAANHVQLRRVACKIVRSADLADDVMQDAYLRIAGCPGDRKIEKPIGYCSQVVRNLALDHCRRQTLECSYRELNVDVELLDIPCTLSPDGLMRERQLIVLIDQALSALAPRTRLVFELNRFEGLTQRAIASRLGCALGLVNRLLAEADQAIGALGYLFE